MRFIFLLLFTIFLSCSSVEDRIKDYSYTDKWYQYKNERYQVYKTKRGSEYIVILNSRETKFIRKYITIQ